MESMGVKTGLQRLNIFNLFCILVLLSALTTGCVLQEAIDKFKDKKKDETTPTSNPPQVIHYAPHLNLSDNNTQGSTVVALQSSHFRLTRAHVGGGFPRNTSVSAHLRVRGGLHAGP